MRNLAKLCIPASMALLLACGGSNNNSSSEPAPDPGPNYTNPVGTGWRLMKNMDLSTGKHLVLDLVGPADGTGLGVALNLDLGPDAAKAVWAPVSATDTALVKNVAYDLGTGSQAFKATVSGSVLKLGVFSKGLSAPPARYTAPLLRVALDLKDGLKAGDTVTIATTRADELSINGVRPVALAIGSIQVK
jgi:hypothetical protein